MRNYLWLFIVILMSACQPADDVAQTLQAGNDLLVAEAEAMAESAMLNRTAVMATLDASSTELAQVGSVNVQLYETLAVGSTATPVLNVVQLVGDGNSMDMMGATSQFDRANRLLVRSGVSSSISEADGCVVNPTITFSSDVPRLYATMRVFNVEAGVPIRAEWSYEDELRIVDEWIADRFSDDRCLWFVLESTRTPFTPGNWSVMMYMDGFFIDAPMPFAIVE